MAFNLIEILIVVLLIFANGLFAMSEIAIVSARKARLQQLAEEGDLHAQTALELANSPTLFLATVQIGITLIGVFTGAFSGTTLADPLASLLSRVPVLGPYSHSLSLGIVVLSVTFLSLMIGELVPKRLALNSPELTATLIARPMRWLSRIASPAVRLLSVTTDFVIRLLHINPSVEPPITEEEIRLLIDQGTLAGVFEQAEQNMVERVFRLADRRVKAIMTHRKKIEWLDVNEPTVKIRRKIAQSVYSRFPVCQGRLGNILGVVHVRELMAPVLLGQPFNLKAAMKEPPFVHENMHVLKVMELFRESGTQFALVVDEYGTIEGLVTVNDILESIVGDLPSIDDEDESKVVQREDGSYLVDGMLPADEIKELLDIRKLPGEEAGHFDSLGGFVMTHLGRIPSEGDRFECCGLSFEVVDMDGHRVDKVWIKRMEETQSGDDD